MSRILAALLTIYSATAYQEIREVPPDFKMPAPLTAEASRAAMKTKPGLTVELVAAEPLVMDPISIDSAPDGRLWVVEMPDYPLGMDGKGKPGGRVRVLADSDGDGQYDHSSLFLDGLNFPTSVKAWRQGVLVVAAPDIIYAEDRDGDGKADHRETLFRGFREGNQQHRVNSLVWGLDNFLHVANGDSGGRIESLKTGQKLELGQFDLKIRPDSGEMMRTSGRTQYGRTRDDFGIWFGCNNSRPLWQIVLAAEDLLRNPHVAYPPSLQQIVDTAPQIFPIGTPSPRFNNPFSSRRITSACGIAIMRDRRLGDFYGNAFICEPVHNLVHRRVLERRGLRLLGDRASDEQQSEFLASSDRWFRPTSCVTGPDGALWVVDMYRFVIEHPEWISKEWEAALDLRAGHDKGRIYRITSDRCGPAVHENLAALENDALIQRLSSGNGWTRDMAHQLLHWRQAKLDGVWQKTHSELGRIHLLSLLGASQPDALDGSHGKAVRRHALRFADDSATEQVIALVDSTDTQTQLAATLALGQLKSPKAGRALARVLESADSAVLRAAALSSLLPHLDAVAETAPSRGHSALFKTCIGAGRHDLATKILDRSLSAESVAAFLDAAKSATRSPQLDAAIARSRAFVAEAAQRFADSQAPTSERLAILSLIDDADLMATVLAQDPPHALFTAVVERLGNHKRYDLLLARFEQLRSPQKDSVLVQCLARSEGVASLLGALERGALPVNSINIATRQQLMAADRQRAEKVLGQASNADRAAVIKKYEGIGQLTGYADLGREHFRQLCIACHKLEGVGNTLGPDLSALADRSPRGLMVAILDPNQAVEDKYRLSTLKLYDGSERTGVVERESPSSVHLRGLDGSEQTILRRQIQTRQDSGRSAMPEGLEAALDRQQLANLIAYIQGVGRAAAIPGTIEAEDFDDAHDLDADNKGKAYRETAVDVEAFAPASNGHRLGWTKAGEWLRYHVEVAAAGRYRIEIPVASKGNGGSIHLELDGEDFSGPIRIPDTGAWETQVTIIAGPFSLPAGPHELRLVMDTNGASRYVGDIDCLTFVEVPPEGAPASIAIGVARRDITPTEPVPLSGFYGRNQPISEVKQKLWAKALVLPTAGGKPAAIVTVDVLGVPHGFRDRVVARLPKELGLQPERLAISASHTHTAPQIKDVAQYIDAAYAAHSEVIDRYAVFLETEVAAAIQAAFENRQPSFIDWSQGSVGFGINRRMLANGKWRGFGKNPDGPVDHALPVMRVRDATGELSAIYVNYACHCTTLMQAEYVHGDWAGDAQAAIEESHPGAMAMVSIGCGADVGPNNYGKGRLDSSQANGQAIAQEVTRLLAKPMTALGAPIIAEAEINLAYDPLPSDKEWRALANGKGARGAYARDVVANLDAGRRVPGSSPYPIQTWTFGDDLAMVYLPGEVVVDYSLRLRQELPDRQLWISAYSNGSPGYIPSRRLYHEGGYEVDSSRHFYGQPSRLAITTEDLIVDWVKRLLSGNQ